jgi:hypothetical protein
MEWQVMPAGLATVRQATETVRRRSVTLLGGIVCGSRAVLGKRP